MKVILETAIVLLLVACGTGKGAVNDNEQTKYVHECKEMGRYELCCGDSAAIAILDIDSLIYHGKRLKSVVCNEHVLLLERKTGIEHSGLDDTYLGIVNYSPTPENLKAWKEWCEKHSECE